MFVIMISVPIDLQNNKFKHVEIPAPVKVFQRNGYLSLSSSQYSGDNTAILMQSKLDAINHVSQVNDHYLNVEKKGSD